MPRATSNSTTSAPAAKPCFIMGGGWLRLFAVPRWFRSNLQEEECFGVSEDVGESVDEIGGEDEVEAEVDRKGEFYSPRIAGMIQERQNHPGMDQVESEIESSKVTWSELSASSVVGDALAEENSRVFRSLQEQWPGGFFQDCWKEGKLEVGEKLAEGGQAEVFLLRRILDDNQHNEAGVIKIFKEGSSLRDLQTLLPHGMLARYKTLRRSYHREYSGRREHYLNEIAGAMLVNGRFAFLMGRKWGDLRKFIDSKMIHNNMQGPPCHKSEALRCMSQIAKGMAELHDRNIIHRDLKAANVLLSWNRVQLNFSHWEKIRERLQHLDPNQITQREFSCEVADYECSVGVVGTGFWRAPEILLAVKDRNVTAELFTQASDMYSYGMTCYEILTGRIPFELENFKANDYDRVIGGYRPELPKRTPNWLKDILSRCWHKNPNMRPTFEEVKAYIENREAFFSDP